MLKIPLQDDGGPEKCVILAGKQIYVTTAHRGIAKAGFVGWKPAIEGIGEGLLSARSWGFTGRLQSVFNQDHPDMREACGSTDLKPSIRQHAQNQHKGYDHRKRVMPDK
jgi:hypothetical protein